MCSFVDISHGYPLEKGKLFKNSVTFSEKDILKPQCIVSFKESTFISV